MRDDEEALQEVIIYMPPDLYPYQRIADQVIQYLLLFYISNREHSRRRLFVVWARLGFDDR